MARRTKQPDSGRLVSWIGGPLLRPVPFALIRLLQCLDSPEQTAQTEPIVQPAEGGSS